MTPTEQIAYLRSWERGILGVDAESRDAVCDLAERALLTDDLIAAAAEALRVMREIEDEDEADRVMIARTNLAAALGRLS